MSQILLAYPSPPNMFCLVYFETSRHWAYIYCTAFFGLNTYDSGCLSVRMFHVRAAARFSTKFSLWI